MIKNNAQAIDKAKDKATLTDFGLSFNSNNYNYLSLCQIGGTYRSPWYTKLSSENSIEKLQKNSNLSLQSFLEKGEIFSWAVMALTLFFPDFNHPYKSSQIYYDSSENNPILQWVENFKQAFNTYLESKKNSGNELSLDLLGKLLSKCLSTDHLMKDTYLPKPTYPDWNEILLLVQFLNPPAALKLRST